MDITFGRSRREGRICRTWHCPPIHAGVRYTILLALLVTWLAEALAKQSCPSEYLRLSSHHSFCLPPSNTCKPVSDGVSNSDKITILNVHNGLRNKVAFGDQKNIPSAANMMQMQWDNELAAIIQQYLKQCKFQHDCNDCRMCDRFPVGQNLYMLASFGPQQPAPNWTDCIYAWYNEVNLLSPSFDVQHMYLPENVDVGHFTQVAWASSWKVGCGQVTFASSKGSGFTQLLGCNYGPAGNLIGGQMYKKGKACSACPGNTCCGASCNSPNTTTTFKGLCNALNDRGPVITRNVSNALLWCNFTQLSSCAVTWKGKSWNVITTIPDNYARLILQAGNSSMANFTTAIKPSSSSFCFSFEYRKGPNVDGNPSSNKLSVILSIPSWKFQTESVMQVDAKTFLHATIQLSWQMETKVSMKFEVPPGSKDQYFDVRNILVSPGSCKTLPE